MTNDNVNSIELCELCDGRSGVPATEVLEVAGHHILVCTPCRQQVQSGGKVPEVPDYSPAGEIQAVVDEDAALDAAGV